MRRTALFMMMATLAPAQPSETRIGPHKMGETFQEWLTAGQVDLVGICGPHKGREATNFKSLCRGLTQIRDSGRGQADVDVNKERFYFQFSGGIVAQAETVYIRPDTEQQIRFLTESYGAPTSTRKVPYQNAMGAKWDCLEARWLLPDGAAIWARESIESLPRQGPTRWLTVTFLSKERIAENSSRKASVNPYAP